MVFPTGADFACAKFSTHVDFSYATFAGHASFSHATFAGHASFFHATFKERVDFTGTTFAAHVDFNAATFAAEAVFRHAHFDAQAYFAHTTFAAEARFNAAHFATQPLFGGTTFATEADFSGTTFAAGATFDATRFSAHRISFRLSRFSGQTLFLPAQEVETHQRIRIFSAATEEVDFRDLVIEPPECLSFRHADFQTCRFLNTDLRKVELTGVLWPKKGARRVVYDEISPVLGEACPWDELERLYRELKQNYDDHRNYAQAGDFHYGEKEMQRRNPATPWNLRVLLWLYWLVSGYGERFRRPLLCALVLLIVGTVVYLLCGLVPKAPILSSRPGTTAFLVMPGAVSRPAPLPITQLDAWLSALHYSFRVMTLLKPEDLEPMGFAKVMQTIQSLLGPLFLGLFALAVRQRLKH
jgi:uncharacterized protein YjbI with pentapeptide repeats